MSDDKSKAPDPIEDLSEGLGKLFRAAKTAVDQIPTDNAEHFMSATAGAVGRALDAVGGAIEREIAGPPAQAPQHAPPEAASSAPSASATPVTGAAPQATSVAAATPPVASTESRDEQKPAPEGDEGPRGPRVA